MIIKAKDSIKLVGISIVMCCAVFVCNLFLNYNIDLARIKDQIESPMILELYDAKCTMIKAICGVSSGCLLLTSVILLFFYIGQYISVHNKELGILKALGYSRLKIAGNFSVFGLSVFWGTAIAYAASFLLMPQFYNTMNQDGMLPDPNVQVNEILILFLVVAPTIIFGVLSVAYAYKELKRPALELLREQQKMKKNKQKKSRKISSKSFLEDLKKSSLKNHKALIFFSAFGAFCYGSMIQMSASIKEVSSEVTGFMMFGIGVILALTSMTLATTTVVNANAKSISIMKVYGYSFKECTRAVLDGYRPIAYIGFVIGTVYQYMLMKIILGIFAGIGDIEIPEVTFKWKVFWATLVTFLLAYEVMMQLFSRHIKKIPVKQVMLE